MQEILWLQQRNLGWFVYIVLLAQHIGIVQIKQTNGAFGLELKRLLAFFCFSPPLPPSWYFPCCWGQKPENSSIPLSPSPLPPLQVPPLLFSKNAHVSNLEKGY